jgi:hypothetical protein
MRREEDGTVETRVDPREALSRSEEAGVLRSSNNQVGVPVVVEVTCCGYGYPKVISGLVPSDIE